MVRLSGTAEKLSASEPVGEVTHLEQFLAFRTQTMASLLAQVSPTNADAAQAADEATADLASV